MLNKTVALGITVTDAAMKQYANATPANALGVQHDEWKVITWGIPKQRIIPANAALSNSVQMRLWMG